MSPGCRGLWDTGLIPARFCRARSVSTSGCALGRGVEVKGSVIPNPFSRLGLCLCIFNLFAVLSCLGLRCQRAPGNTASRRFAKPGISGSVAVIRGS